MKISRIGVSLAATFALALTACSGSDTATPGAGTSSTPAGGTSTSASAGTDTSSAPAEQAAAPQGTLQGGGASSQDAVMTAWMKEVAAKYPGFEVKYDVLGSGPGREGFLGGKYMFAGSDASLKPEEFEKSKAVCGPDGAFNIPAYISPIAIIFNVKGVDQNLKLDAATIAKIFRGDITTWNDPAIAATNEGVTLPATKITPVHRAEDSGTTENFTDYLSKASGGVWTDEPDGNWPKSLAGENASKTSGLVQLVSSTDGAIGYADNSAVGDLKTVDVKVGDAFTPISSEAAAKVVESSPKVEGGSPKGDMAVELQRDTTTSGAYPIVLVSYHVFCYQYPDQQVADNIKAFAKYVVSQEGQKVAADNAGSAPISQKLTDDADKLIDQITAK